jgi:hypothetical protein
MNRDAKLLSFIGATGPIFGTEAFSLLLHSLVKLQVPKTIVELGTGFGTSALAMACAAKANGAGHVWSIDNHGIFNQDITLLPRVLEEVQREWNTVLNFRTAEQYYAEIADHLEVQGVISFIKGDIQLGERGEFDRYPFSKLPIDLLFSDFRHSPRDILAILAHFLPKMASASSIFLDSASTLWPSYLLLEQLVQQLNQGTIPACLQDLANADLHEILRHRRINLIHLTEGKERSQNSTAWLKIEPVDLFPYPRVKMRGVF